MSRSGYDDGGGGCWDWDLIRYRGQVASATRGKRGQLFFRAMLAALDAMPTKRLVEAELVCDDGVCALGALGQARGIDFDNVDPYDHDSIGGKLDVAQQLVAEVSYENDEESEGCTPEERWTRMRRWVARQIVVTPEEANAIEMEDLP